MVSCHGVLSWCLVMVSCHGVLHCMVSYHGHSVTFLNLKSSPWIVGSLTSSKPFFITANVYPREHILLMQQLDWVNEPTWPADDSWFWEPEQRTPELLAHESWFLEPAFSSQTCRLFVRSLCQLRWSVGNRKIIRSDVKQFCFNIPT